MHTGPVIARHLIVHGVVQGVGFRWSMATEARRHGVHGWVRNTFDGTVEAHVEGEQPDVDAVVRWAHEGPRHARVTYVEEDVATPTGALVFDVEP